jgi:signal transduction histidine kinase
MFIKQFRSNQLMKSILLSIFLLLTSCATLAQKGIIIDKKITVLDISQSVSIWKDSTTKLPFEKIRQQSFQAYSADFLHHSSPSDILWLKFNIINKQADTLKLLLNCGKQFFLDLYQVYPDGSIRQTSAGVFVDWKKLIDGYGLPIVLTANQSSEIYLRIGTDAFYTQSLLVVPKLFDEAAYIQNQKNNFWDKRYLAILYFLTIGFLACGIVLAIFQYYTFPDKAILYYLGVIFLAEIMIIRVAEFHLDLRIISSFFPDFFGYLYVIQIVLGFTYYLFVAAMFSLKRQQPHTYQIMKKGALVYLIVLIICLLSTLSILHNRSVLGSSFKIAGVLSMLSIVFMILITYFSARQLNAYNQYIIYGFTFMVIGYGITFYLNRIQAGQYLYAYHFWKIPSIYMCLGTAGELIFFMIALSKRSRLLEKEGLIKGQTLERKRVAGELHDHVNSLLASVKVGLQSLRPSENQSKIYENVIKMVDNASYEVRQISHNMLPSELEKEGLSHALLSLVMRLNLGENTHFELFLDALKQRLAPEIEFNIYMICLELCQNISKHAEATKSSIDFEKLNNQLIMFVWDNGKGFDKAQIEEGMGLKNIRHRAKSIGADLQIQSHDDGTIFYLKIPLNQSSYV